MKTKSELFFHSRIEMWRELASLMDLIRTRGIKKLSALQVESFPSLYRRACQDLAQARMEELSPDLIEYLNNLTGQAHFYLYYTRPLSWEGTVNFFKLTLPGIILKTYKPVLAAFLIFWLSALGTFWAVSRQPELAVRLIPQSTLEMMKEMYQDSPSQGRSRGEQTSMAAYYIQHNISIAFLCFATGVFLGIGSVIFLMYNGIFLGTIFAYLIHAGLGRNILVFVTAHSFLELNGVVLSGAAGLLMGLSLLNSWKLYSLDGLKVNRDEILTLLGASALLIFMAAFIEGLLSPSRLAYPYKVATALISVAGILLFFFIIPLRKRNRL